MRYAVLSITLGAVVGLVLSIIVNNHFANYEEKCYNFLYEAGKHTTTTEVPCK